MENPNKTNTRTFDLIKGGVLLVLVVILVFAVVRGADDSPEISGLPTQAGSGRTPGLINTLVPGTLPPPLTPGELGVAPPVVSPSGGVTFSGTGPPGSKVEIWANGEIAGEATVGPDGTWSVEGQPPPGDYQVSVITRDANGMVIDQTSPVGVTVPPAGGTAAGGTPPPSNQTPGAPAEGAPAVSEATVSETGEVTVSGTGTPGSTVVIYEDGVPAATAVVGADGTYTVSYQSTPGEHVFVAQPEGAAPPESGGQATPGTSSTSSPAATESTSPGATGTATPGTAPTTPQAQATATQTPGPPTPTPTLIPIPPGGLVYIVQPGDGLMDLARRYYGDPALWVDIFVATNAMAYQDPSFAVLTDPNYIVAGWKIFIPEP
jgi:nucleoid-associated protein YgaU